MPISKRDKEVSLTKTKKVTKEKKSGLIEEVRKCVAEYENLFVFSTSNMRSAVLVQVRQHFKKEGRIFYGKNNLIAFALGRNEETEIANKLHKVSNVIKGECGLLFTNQSVKEIKNFCSTFAEDEYARAGTTINQDVVLPQGPILEFAGSLEPYLRKLGLPTKLENGNIELIDDFQLCAKNDVLTPEQAKLLKLFKIKTTSFQLQLIAHWSKKKGFKSLE